MSALFRQIIDEGEHKATVVLGIDCHRLMRNLADSGNDEFFDGGVYRLEERAVPIFIEELPLRISEPAQEPQTCCCFVATYCTFSHQLRSMVDMKHCPGQGQREGPEVSYSSPSTVTHIMYIRFVLVIGSVN